MADVIEELSEDVDSAIGNLVNRNSTAVVDDEDAHFFDDLKNDPFFDGSQLSPHIDDAHCCKVILYQSLSAGSNVRLWDVAILVPTLLFLLFLLARFRSARQKLRATNSPVFRTFYGLVFVSAVVGVVRTFVSMSVSSASPAGDEADRILWILLRFFLLATEMSVLVFSLAAGHLESRRSIRRVLVITSCVSLAFSITQGILELNYPDPNFHVETAKMNLFGHGGMLFWLVSSAVFTVVYLFVLLLPFLPCRHYVSLPHKRSFYQYVGFLLFLNGVQTAGSIMVYASVADGLCLVNLSSYLYFTLFTPIVYFAFLRGFFKVAQPTLLFSYKAQVDDFDGGEMSQSASLQFQQHRADDDDNRSTPIVLNGVGSGVIIVANGREEREPMHNTGIASPESVVNYNFAT